jgi:hypothetical protein
MNAKRKSIEKVSSGERKIYNHDFKDLTDWEKVRSMTEEEITRNALEDPDALPFDDDWEEAVIVYPDKHKE